MQKVMIFILLIISGGAFAKIYFIWASCTKRIQKNEKVSAQEVKRTARQIGTTAIFVGLPMGVSAAFIRAISYSSTYYDKPSFFLYCLLILLFTLGWPGILVFAFTMKTDTLKKSHNDNESI